MKNEVYRHKNTGKLWELTGQFSGCKYPFELKNVERQYYIHVTYSELYDDYELVEETNA